jgi:hypothetical protein
VKAKTKNRTTIGPLTGDDGVLTSNDEEMALVLNGFFFQGCSARMKANQYLT